MNKVVSINSRRVLGAYCDAQDNERIPEEAFFFTGVLLSVVLPQIIFCAYGGIIAVIAFTGSVLVGSLLGLAMLRQTTYRTISCLSIATVPQVPPGEDITAKKVA